MPDRFLIAPLQLGLTTNLKPWQIPDSAFARLENSYIFRGRLRKRFGSRFMGTTSDSALTAQLFSRLRLSVGNTDGSGDLTVTVPGNYFAIGQLFSVGDQIFTVYQASGATYATTGTGTATFNTANGDLIITGAAITTAVYYYPATPVMGLTNLIGLALNDRQSVAFDTQFCYVFVGFWLQLIGATLTPIWHGGNLDFFWPENWQGPLTTELNDMIVTNFFCGLLLTASLTDDPIWVWTGTDWFPLSYSPVAALNPNNLQPLTVTRTTSGNNSIIASYVQSCRIIVAFKNRLLLLNTIENNANGATAFNTGSPTTTGITPTNYQTSQNFEYTTRCRFSHFGSPYSSNAWLEPNFTYNPGGTGTVFGDGGGFIDATTDEQIISAGFIKDRLIVYFERSTWEIAFTGNQINPFIWQKINTELGADAQNSAVPFDKVLLGIANTGVHACTGTNVERIDNQIPDEIFNIVDANDGPQRVAGIRDYYTELVYWTLPSDDANPVEVYPTRVLVYNYKNNSWSINDDCITAWGYFDQQPGLTWAAATFTWANANMTWGGGTLATQFRQVIAGNQEGFTFIVDSDESRNSPSLQITNMVINGAGVNLTIIDHTLSEGVNNPAPYSDYILIENAQGVTGLNGNIYPVYEVIDSNTIWINPATFTGTYTGGGTASRVSTIRIQSKQWNPYVDKGQNVYLSKIDFAVERTANGQITADYLPSYTQLSMVQQGGPTGTNSLIGTNILETSPYTLVALEQQQDLLWHTVYFSSVGEAIQLYLYFNEAQMINPAISLENFVLEGLVLHTAPSSIRLQ